MFKTVILFFVSTLISVTGSAAVWSHAPDRVWSEKWENNYAAWFEKNVTPDWLQQPGFIFYNVKVDCAKFAFLTRLYFSYENNLEFAILNSSGKKIISSRDSSWDEIADSTTRVQKFTEVILNNISTSNLPQNTVLAKSDSSTIRPGLILAGDQARRHTWVIQKINPSGIPQLIYGTLPASEYLYTSYVFPSPAQAFPEGQLPTNASGGFRRFRWPEDLLKKSNLISYHSEEQSDPAISKFESFFDDIQSKLRVVAKNEDQDFGYLMDDLCMKVRTRVNIIIDAGQALQRKAAKDFTAEDIELYSTTKRDRDIRLTIEKLDSARITLSERISASNLQRFDSILHPAWTTMDECLVTWADNRTEPLGALRERFLKNLMSDKATDSFSLRWGEPR